MNGNQPAGREKTQNYYLAQCKVWAGPTSITPSLDRPKVLIPYYNSGRGGKHRHACHVSVWLI